MTNLLEIKDKIIKLCENYETYVNLVVKFVLAFALFMIINANIGYMTRVNSVPVALILALVCCILPAGGTLVIAGVLVMLHMYALSLEVAAVTLILLFIMYLIYFRFAPKESMAAVLMPICLKLHIPYVVPVGCGLMRKGYAVLSVLCATVLYYYLAGIKQNEAVFAAALDEDAEVSSKFSIAIAQLTGNKEMFLVVGMFLVSGLVVYYVRRMNIENAWTIAIISGILIQLCGLFAGYMIIGISERILGLVIGSIVSMLLSFGLEFFFMNLDYARTERVQFEDDEYYYYVKAVPKKQVASAERTVKHFGNTASMGKRIDYRKEHTSAEDEEMSSRVIARELDIDEEMLK